MDTGRAISRRIFDSIDPLYGVTVRDSWLKWKFCNGALGLEDGNTAQRHARAIGEIRRYFANGKLRCGMGSVRDGFGGHGLRGLRSDGRNYSVRVFRMPIPREWKD